MIGDLQTGALVTTDGTVDWFCCPRFDSPSVFASLLDADKGGHFRIAPDRDDYVSRQLYLPETAILITRFMTPNGVGEVHDFMPVLTGRATDRHRLVRLLRVPRGTMRFAMDLQPRFGYGRRPHTLTVSDDGAMFESEGMYLTLHTAGGRNKIMYRVDGSSDLSEESLDHFEGWRGSRPVSIRNGAADQLQLDIYGEAMDGVFLGDAHGLQVGHQGWRAIADTIDWVCEHWDQPDEGIWETRGGRKDFTYGRFQSWVALDRAIRLAQRHGRPANLARWMTERDEIYQDIMTRGWNAKEPAPSPSRADRRAARQLPAGLQPPVADRRGDQPGLSAQARRRAGDRGARARLASVLAPGWVMSAGRQAGLDAGGDGLRGPGRRPLPPGCRGPGSSR